LLSTVLLVFFLPFQLCGIDSFKLPMIYYAAI
jgi:hypothetical protein